MTPLKVRTKDKCGPVRTLLTGEGVRGAHQSPALTPYRGPVRGCGPDSFKVRTEDNSGPVRGDRS